MHMHRILNEPIKIGFAERPQLVRPQVAAHNHLAPPREHGVCILGRVGLAQLNVDSLALEELLVCEDQSRWAFIPQDQVMLTRAESSQVNVCGVGTVELHEGFSIASQGSGKLSLATT